MKLPRHRIDFWRDLSIDFTKLTSSSPDKAAMEDYQRDLRDRFGGRTRKSTPTDEFKLKLMQNQLTVEDRIKKILGENDSNYCDREHLCEDAEKTPECSGCVVACQVRDLLKDIKYDFSERERKLLEIGFDSEPLDEYSWPKCYSCGAYLEATNYQALIEEMERKKVPHGGMKTMSVVDTCFHCDRKSLVRLALKDPQLIIEVENGCRFG